MKDALLLVATCAIAAVGFAMMAFSQKQHWPLRQGSNAPRLPEWLRLTGALFLMLAAIPAVLRDGLAFGLLLWSGMLTVSGVLVIVCLARLHGRAHDQSTR
jgi:hypothetical protein